MPTTGWFIPLLLALAAWTAFAFFCRWLMRNPRGDIEGGMALLALAVYVRLVHRVRFVGREHIPMRGPLIVVSNHTGGVDPLLIQSATRKVEVRWMMAQDMMLARMDPLWAWLRIIPVQREGNGGGGNGGGGGGRGDAASAREALRHLKHGGVLGVFPEGGIERPPRQLKPFAPGVGLLALKTGCPVLPVAVTGTPYGETAWASLLRPSRATVTFLPPVVYTDRSVTPAQIADDIRRRLQETTGWPLNDG